MRLRSTLVFFVLAIVLVALGNVVRAHLYEVVPGREGEWPFLEYGMVLQYLVDYGDIGFVRRTLVGTLVPGDPALGVTTAVLVAATAPPVLAAAVMAPLLARLADRGLAIALAVSPALFWQLGYDLGRFDTINLLIALGILLSPWRWALMAAPVMLLVHEAVAVILMPVLFALHWQRFGAGAPMVVAGVAVLVVTAAVVGLSARPDETAVLAAYPVAEVDSARVFGRSLSDNLALTWRHLTDGRPARQFWMLAPPALYVAALVVVAARMLRAESGARVALAAALSPLLLAPLGTDYARWLALAGANVILVALVSGGASSPRAPRAAVAALMAAAVLGPMGILFGFPAAQFWRPELF